MAFFDSISIPTDYGTGKLGVKGRNGGEDSYELGSELSSGTRDPVEEETQITVVPILGVLSVFLVFLGLVVYCYRHRALSSSSSQPDVHLLPLQESPMGSVVPQAGSSRSESDTEADNVPLHMVYLERNGGGVEHGFVPAPRSPLGSVVGTDSDFDHGYSTMNNDDSECGAPLPLVYLEPPPQPRYRNTPPSISTLETLTHNYSQESTQPHALQLLVPVSVHQVASTGN